MKKTLGLLFIYLLVSCTEEDISPEDAFTKIYDSNRSDLSFRPIDVAETEEGFIILASQDNQESTFFGVQLIEIDKEGNFVSESSLDETHVIPTGEFTTIGNSHYFFTMNPLSLQAQLVRVGSSAEDIQVLDPGSGLQYPLASSKTSDNQLLLVSYSLDNGQTVLSKIDTTGNLTGGNGYTIGAGNEVEDDIIDHYIDPERSRLPFFCGEMPDGSYYFNGFYNFSLSLVFTNLSADPSGVIQGQRANGGISYALPLDNSTFSMFGFQFNDNFVQYKQTIDINSITSSVDYLSLTSSEFVSRSPAIIRSYVLNEVTYSVLAAETQSRQIGLYFYNVETGLLDGIHLIGFLNPFNLGTIKIDEDNNIIVLGSTLVSDRFQRVFLNKISESEVKGILK